MSAGVILVRRLTALAVSAGSLGFPSQGVFTAGATAQPISICIPIAEQDSVGAYLLNRIATFSVHPDSAFNESRILYRLPLVRANQISLVTDEKTCRKAATTYAAALTGKGKGLSGRVLVARVGFGSSLRYVVLDPYFAYDPTRKSYVHLVLDPDFKVLHIFP